MKAATAIVDLWGAVIVFVCVRVVVCVRACGVVRSLGYKKVSKSKGKCQPSDFQSEIAIAIGG